MCLRHQRWDARDHAAVTISCFQRVPWQSDDPGDPVVLWSHVLDGWERRKVDEFADGRLVVAHARLGRPPYRSEERTALMVTAAGYAIATFL